MGKRPQKAILEERRALMMAPRDRSGRCIPGPNICWPYGMDNARRMAAALFLQYETAYVCNVRDIEDEEGNTTDAVYRCSIGRASRRDEYDREGWDVRDIEDYPDLVELHPNLPRG